MKKIFILLVSIGLFAASCNNNKKGNDENKNNREKDDYSKNENGNKDDNKDDFKTTSNWSAADISSFNAQCLTTVNNNEEVAKDFCPCLLEKFQAKYSSLAEMDRNGTEEEGKKAGEECMTAIKGIDDNSHTASSWSVSDESQWMKACTTPLIKSLGEERATNYCSCVMDRLKELYSSYDEANTKGTKQMGEELGKKCLKELGLGQ